MAVNILLKIEGPKVEGESVIAGHEGEIDVSSWGWGMTQSGSMHIATGGGTGKVSVQDIHVSKKVDKASPILMKHCCSGQHFDKATLFIFKAGGDQPVQYLTIKMDKVLISSVQHGGHDGDDTINESISLNFSKHELEYKPQTVTGVESAGVRHTWDIAKNQP